MLVEEFIELGDFIKPDEKYDEYMWDDFDKVRELIKNNEGLHCYTIVSEGAFAYIIEGMWRSNRLGYLFSRKYVELPDDSVRYY